MLATMTENPTVVRTERGLSIKGTRITLYDVMDYLQVGWPAKLIGDWLSLTREQIDDVMTYIEMNRTEVALEYQRVVERAEEVRRYWEERNRDRMKPMDPSTLSPERRALWEKLEAWKERLAQP